MKYKILIAIGMLLLTGCAKQEKSIHDCVVERDQLQSQLLDANQKLMQLRNNFNNEVESRVASKKAELNITIESYNSLINKVNAENVTYRNKLRWIVIISFIGVFGGIILINVVMFLRRHNKLIASKTYEK